MKTHEKNLTGHGGFVKEVWEALNRLGWSPTDLARASGLSQATISRVLNGQQTNLTLNTIQKIKNALLMGGDGGVPSKPDVTKWADGAIVALRGQVAILKGQLDRANAEITRCHKLLYSGKGDGDEKRLRRGNG